MILIIEIRVTLISLLNEGEVIIDEEDFTLINSYKWYKDGDGYAKTYSPKIRRLHKILNPKWNQTDHINGNRLDNRRSNLRECTRIQNQMNRKKYRNGLYSKYKGVYKESQCHQRYVAKIRVNKKLIHLGCFKTEEEAAKKYDDAARNFFGEFARVNFPNEKTEDHLVGGN